MERSVKRSCRALHAHHRLAIDHFKRFVRLGYAEEDSTNHTIHFKLYNRRRQSDNRALSCFSISWPAEVDRRVNFYCFIASFYSFRVHCLRQYRIDPIASIHSITHQIKFSPLDSRDRLCVLSLRAHASATSHRFCGRVSNVDPPGDERSNKGT